VNPPDGDALLTKRVLVGLSHAVERFALTADRRDPLVVIALFQRWSYFEREAATYRDLAARGAVTVVGLVDDFPPGSPRGVHHRLLAADDALAREWSVAVLGPHGGASLVAIDQESVAPDAVSFEHGRQFRGRWSFRREDAYEHVLRLRSELRLPAETVARVDEVLRAVACVGEPPRQSWWEAPLRSLAADMERAERGRGRARSELSGRADRDAVTGLPTRARLEQWTARLGRGTLSVGLVALRLLDVDDLRARHGVRVELGAVQAVANGLAQLAHGAERLVQLGRHDFLLVLPSAQSARVIELSRAACAQVAQLQSSYPFVTLRAATACALTRDRPLPVARLLAELDTERSAVDPVG
jgi:DICT domain-containing protein/GGDEF domain-containing protein